MCQVRRRTRTGELAGAVAGGLVISLCSVLPSIGEAAGATGSRASALLAPWQPYFMVLAFVLLGAAKADGRKPDAADHPPRRHLWMNSSRAGQGT